MSLRTWFPIVILLALATGCSSINRQAVYPVTGAVFVRGEPAIGARIFFCPAESATDPRGLRPFAVVDKDGSFRVTTYMANDGAPAGDYIVLVIWSEKVAGPSGNDNAARGPDRLKNAYADPAAPKLRATVKPGTNTLEPFRLD